ncbi:MAG TPA: glycosyl hydrolase 53 family protein, partial [Ferruginibacter sp.]|nr:glycosyl hydrolase 53 family protein [Ferruginibacter sp.]
WVQVGNETNDGMLWPDGRASTNMAQFAQLIDAGYAAVKAIFPESKVVVHVSNGYDNGLFRWLFDGLKANNARFDVIGMSLYPSYFASGWQNANAQCLQNMNDMVSRYNKPVMIVEVGMPWDQASTCEAFISDLISKVKSVPDRKGLGVLYWEPLAYANWKGYTLGAFDNTGKPTVALNAFQ